MAGARLRARGRATRPFRPVSASLSPVSSRAGIRSARRSASWRGSATRFVQLSRGSISKRAISSAQLHTFPQSSAAETRYRAIQADRIFTWIAWGLGVAALGTSIGLGVEAASRQANLPDAREWAAYSDGLLGAAIGLGVVGLILYFVEGRSVGTERITVSDEEAASTRVRGP